MGGKRSTWRGSVILLVTVQLDLFVSSNTRQGGSELRSRILKALKRHMRFGRTRQSTL